MSIAFSSYRDDTPTSGANYWFKSPTDPRFSGGGWAYGLWDARAKMDAEILAIAERLGIEPPDDIEIGACKI